jgi:hypothetical protein
MTRQDLNTEVYVERPLQQSNFGLTLARAGAKPLGHQQPKTSTYSSYTNNMQARWCRAFVPLIRYSLFFCRFFPGTHTHGQASSFFFVNLASCHHLGLSHSAPPCTLRSKPGACCPCAPVHAASYAQVHPVAVRSPGSAVRMRRSGCPSRSRSLHGRERTAASSPSRILHSHLRPVERASALMVTPCARRHHHLSTVDSGSTSAAACKCRVPLVALDGRIQFARGSPASERHRASFRCLTTSQPPPFLYRRSTRRAGMTFSWSCIARCRFRVRRSRTSPSVR